MQEIISVVGLGCRASVFCVEGNRHKMVIPAPLWSQISLFLTYYLPGLKLVLFTVIFFIQEFCFLSD